MAEPFKETLALKNVQMLADTTERLSADAGSPVTFSASDYIKALKEVAPVWDDLSLMERLRTAASVLCNQLPYPQGAYLLVDVLESDSLLSGWLSLICCEYIALQEEADIPEALGFLAQMTSFFSAEFAIRPLIRRDPEACMKVFRSWVGHENHHVRRLVSEGTRPRLPWGIRLHEFIDDPEFCLPLLEALKDDPEEYVRRSVANHLNDIAKDHPELVIRTAQSWLEDISAENEKHRTKLVRHACRTLFKKGRPDALALFGYHPADNIVCEIETADVQVTEGDEFSFSVKLHQKDNRPNRLMIDYAIHYMKANGKTSPKVFRWLDRQVEGAFSETIIRKHSFRPVTTRRHYPGVHKTEIIINGVPVAETSFELFSQT